MESVVPTKSITAPTLSPGFGGKLIGNGGGLTANRNYCCCCFVLANGYFSSSSSSFLPYKLTTTSLKRTPVIAAAKKNNNYKKKPDKHSFVPKPDESTGPYPEAVLLKQKKVQEDGSLLPDFADDEEKELYESLNLELETDDDVGQMRHYEVVYLIHQDYVDEVESVNLKINDFLREKKGIVWRFSDWGIRRLAYEIRKANFAHYFLMNIELKAKWINDLKSLLDKDERVIRHLVIKMDKAVTEDCPPPPEFHTIRAGTDDEDEDEDDEEYEDDDEEEYEDDDEEEYEDDDDEEEYEDDVEDGDEERIFYVDEDDSESKSNKTLVASGRRKAGANKEVDR